MTVAVSGPASLVACDIDVPGDPSSAAFLAAAGLLVPGSEVELTGVGMNPTRVGFALVLQRMGADIDREPRVPPGPEPVEEFTVRYTPHLRAVDVAWQEVPRLVDEVPILALVAARCEGTTRFNGVRELRVKEADRLRAVHEGLDAFGAAAGAGEDWLEVGGPSALHAAHVSSLGDHRLAMTWAVAGLIAEGETLVEDFGAVEVSYPGFADDLRRLGASVGLE
jgi:3-phosphoshikimate 1-carboxyvinyltransferase